MIPKLERASFITISKDFLAIADSCVPIGSVGFSHPLLLLLLDHLSGSVRWDLMSSRRGGGQGERYL